MAMSATQGILAFLQLSFMVLLSMAAGLGCEKLSKMLTTDVTKQIAIPPLLGMLIVGLVVGNVPGDLLRDLPQEWSIELRRIALVVILLRAGLGLDLVALRAKGAATIRLASIPCIVESTTAAIMARHLLDFSWGFSFASGYVIAAVSPAVVVPSLLALQEEKYGTEKGIPTMVLAAASMDDVLALSLFGIASSLAFSQEGISSFDGSDDMELILNITSAPIQLIGGIGGGWCVGKIVGRISINTHVASPASSTPTSAVSQNNALAVEMASVPSALGVVDLSQVDVASINESEPASVGRSHKCCTLGRCYSNPLFRWYHLLLPRGLMDLPSSMQGLATIRFAAIFVPCMAIVVITDEFSYKGLGYLCTMVAGAIAAQEWNKHRAQADNFVAAEQAKAEHATPGDGNMQDGNCQMVIRPDLLVEEHRAFLGSKGTSTWIGSVWWLFQPILFSLIGAAVNVSAIEASVVGFAVAILAVGITLRLAATYVAVGGVGLDPIERAFVALAWLPKATVQAAIGSTVLDTALSNNASDEIIGWGENILTISVLSILLTAPIGALIIAYTGRRWLEHESTVEVA